MGDADVPAWLCSWSISSVVDCAESAHESHGADAACEDHCDDQRDAHGRVAGHSLAPSSRVTWSGRIWCSAKCPSHVTYRSPSESIRRTVPVYVWSQTESRTRSPTR